MSDGSSGRDGLTTDEHVFACPACGQEISVNEEMRRAILANGCPVCACSVDERAFEK